MSNIEFDNLGAQVKELRIQMKLTQAEVAEALNVTPGYISNVENNRTAMSLRVLIYYAKLMNISLDSLIGKIEPEYRKNALDNELLALAAKLDDNQKKKLIKEESKAMMPKIYLAPMEGLTTYVFRRAYRKYFGGIDKYFTPFIANRSLSSRERNEILPEHNTGMRLVPQILTNRADEFLDIAGQLADYGYDTVNLNLGCPSGTVTAKKRGAGFLAYPDELREFLDAVYDKCPIKVSVKTRIGVSDTVEWEQLLRLYAEFPMEELIIHPRLQRELYAGRPHTDAFRCTQERLAVPLCYNGDIVSPESLDALTKQLHPVQAVMIGRGIL